MDHLQQFRYTIRHYLFAFIVADNILIIAIWWLLTALTPLDPLLIALISLALSLVASCWLMVVLADIVMEPLVALWQAVMHLSPTVQGVEAPKLQELKRGRELVSGLAAQIYQFADVANSATGEADLRTHDLARNFIAQNLPLPLIVLDPEQNILFANEAAAKYIGVASVDLIGKNVYMVLDMSFPNEDTFDSWLKQVKQKSATATATWERVRLNVRDNHPTLLFDMAAYYNRSNPDRIETLLTLFDHTKQYSQDDQAISFVALGVHELRTPLTLMRGYIEVFEEELINIDNPELHDFMQKMRSQAEQLTAFVNNILNVARIDDDQLEVHIQEENWTEVLKAAVQSMSLRAKVRGITLSCHLAKDLPTVGVDRLSIQEVVSNLIDNAIKYSGESKAITIETRLNAEGLVETTIQDSGLGIPDSVMPNLFTKFYRDHHNRAQIGGTGLGLYLCKAIVSAHGGTIWVRSKEGQGSTFGFTLVPFAKLGEAGKASGERSMVRGAHGWIKNHSLYRR